MFDDGLSGHSKDAPLYSVGLYARKYEQGLRPSCVHLASNWEALESRCVVLLRVVTVRLHIRSTQQYAKVPEHVFCTFAMVYALFMCTEVYCVGCEDCAAPLM